MSHQNRQTPGKTTSSIACLVRGFCTTICWVASSVLLGPVVSAGDIAELDLRVIDAETRESIAVRFHITNSLGRAPRIRGVPRLGNDFTFRDTLTFRLKSGHYKFTIDRGPHYTQRSGHLKADRDGFDQKVLVLPRITNPREEGWYGGDLCVRRRPADLELLVDAEELDVAAVPTWFPQVALSALAAKQSRDRQVMGQSLVDLSVGVAETDGGRLLAANFAESVEPMEFPSDLLGFATEAREHATAHLSVLDPYAWDLPMLVAHGLVDSVNVFNELQEREEDRHQFKGRQFMEPRFKAPQGLARYNQHIYFQLLNCGLRIAPAALSGSGDTKSPPGFNRVYVHCADDFSSDTWWERLKQGNAIVSNGPLLRARANQQLPGHVFTATKGDTVELEVTCSLSTRQKIEYLEIIRDGDVVESVRLDKWAESQGRLPPVKFEQSGWMLVRAVSTMGPTYRAAMTAPFHVEFDGEPRVSKSAAQFFVDWVYERARSLRQAKLDRETMGLRIAAQRRARDFFQVRVEHGNAP